MSYENQTIFLEMEVSPEAWSTNQDRRLNPYKRAEMIALWKQGAFLAFRKYRLKNMKPSQKYLGSFATVRVRIPFKSKRVRDPHNYCGTVVKAVIDGLTQANAWPDDTPEYVQHIEPVLYVGDSTPMVEITLTR